MREVYKKEEVIEQVRKKQRHYFVEYNTGEGHQKKRFEYLKAAREFAVTVLGLNVRITNKNGIILPI